VIETRVDAIGVATISRSTTRLVGRMVELFRGSDIEDVAIFVIGTLEPAHAAELRKIGVAAVFSSSTPLSEVVDFVCYCLT
jgi:methylmalonyl-CoA mutase cobalamin-binding domain/chain